MTTTALRLLLAAAVATAAVAPAAAHAQPVSSGSSGGSAGKSCKTDSGGTVEDGYVGTFRTKGVRGSVTCTDGTLCRSTGVLQGDNKTRVWRYECTDANGTTTRTVATCTKRTRWRCTIARLLTPGAIKPVLAPATGSGQAGPTTGATAGGTSATSGTSAPASPQPRASDSLPGGGLAVAAR